VCEVFIARHGKELASDRLRAIAGYLGDAFATPDILLLALLAGLCQRQPPRTLCRPVRCNRQEGRRGAGLARARSGQADTGSNDVDSRTLSGRSPRASRNRDPRFSESLLLDLAASRARARIQRKKVNAGYFWSEINAAVVEPVLTPVPGCLVVTDTQVQVKSMTRKGNVHLYLGASAF
jgi:hypothetical protein